MSVPKQIKNYLDKKGAKYALVTHRKVYTAYDAAQTLKKKLDEIVKNLLIKTDQGFVLVLLPASRNVDLKKLKKVMNSKGKGVKKVGLPKEGEMVRLLKIKPGALPSFGSLHKLEVYLDKSLQKIKKGVFPAGSFTESVEMAVKEFEKLEEPVVGLFSEIKKLKKPAKKVIKQAKKSVKKVVEKAALKNKKNAKQKTISKKSKKTSKKKK